MKTMPILALTAVAAFTFAGCSRGGAEQAGEKADSVIEQSTGGQKDLTDGPMENAGEAADKAASDTKQQLDDAKAEIKGAAPE